jgi:hypothetical protein
MSLTSLKFFLQIGKKERRLSANRRLNGWGFDMRILESIALDILFRRSRVTTGLLLPLVLLSVLLLPALACLFPPLMFAAWEDELEKHRDEEETARDEMDKLPKDRKDGCMDASLIVIRLLKLVSPLPRLNWGAKERWRAAIYSTESGDFSGGIFFLGEVFSGEIFRREIVGGDIVGDDITADAEVVGANILGDGDETDDADDADDTDVPFPRCANTVPLSRFPDDNVLILSRWFRFPVGEKPPLALSFTFLRAACNISCRICSPRNALQ